MEMEKGIRIRAQKEVDSDGQCGYKITALSVLPKERLPTLYTEGKGYVVIGKAPGWSTRYDEPALLLIKDGEPVYVNLKKSPYIANRFYTNKEMGQILDHVREAGENLAKINRELKKKRSIWSGELVFIDGYLKL